MQERTVASEIVGGVRRAVTIPAGVTLKVESGSSAGERTIDVLWGIPSDNCLIALAVDSANRLLATDFASASPLFQIDPATGNLTNLGNTGLVSTMGAAAAPAGA